jgi:hypothetical protein
VHGTVAPNEQVFTWGSCTIRLLLHIDTSRFGLLEPIRKGFRMGSSYVQREEIFHQHRRSQQGLYWVLANDPAIPKRYRDAYRNQICAWSRWSPRAASPAPRHPRAFPGVALSRLASIRQVFWPV